MERVTREVGRQVSSSFSSSSFSGENRLSVVWRSIEAIILCILFIFSCGVNFLTSQHKVELLSFINRFCFFSHVPPPPHSSGKVLQRWEKGGFISVGAFDLGLYSSWVWFCGDTWEKKSMGLIGKEINGDFFLLYSILQSSLSSTWSTRGGGE